jgi:hypothetical protein
MIKFDKSKKIGLSDLALQNIRFYQFQSKTDEEAKLEDLRIQGALEQENCLKGIMGSR